MTSKIILNRLMHSSCSRKSLFCILFLLGCAAHKGRRSPDIETKISSSALEDLFSLHGALISKMPGPTAGYSNLFPEDTVVVRQHPNGTMAMTIAEIGGWTSALALQHSSTENPLETSGPCENGWCVVAGWLEVESQSFGTTQYERVVDLYLSQPVAGGPRLAAGPAAPSDTLAFKAADASMIKERCQESSKDHVVIASGGGFLGEMLELSIANRVLRFMRPRACRVWPSLPEAICTGIFLGLPKVGIHLATQEGARSVVARAWCHEKPDLKEPVSNTSDVLMCNTTRLQVKLRHGGLPDQEVAYVLGVSDGETTLDVWGRRLEGEEAVTDFEREVNDGLKLWGKFKVRGDAWEDDRGYWQTKTEAGELKLLRKRTEGGRFEYFVYHMLHGRDLPHTSFSKVKGPEPGYAPMSCGVLEESFL